MKRRFTCYREESEDSDSCESSSSDDDDEEDDEEDDDEEYEYPSDEYVDPFKSIARLNWDFIPYNFTTTEYYPTPTGPIGSTVPGPGPTNPPTGPIPGPGPTNPPTTNLDPDRCLEITDFEDRKTCYKECNQWLDDFNLTKNPKSLVNYNTCINALLPVDDDASETVFGQAETVYTEDDDSEMVFGN